MATEDFIIDLFYRVDVVLHDVPKHHQASLYPSEIVTLALRFALKGVGNRACSRWIRRDERPLFPKVPDRTRLFRLHPAGTRAHQEWADRFLAEPTGLGVADSYGIELLHPLREGRSARQMGKTGKSNHRWIIGGKLGYVVNQWGFTQRVPVAWDWATANVHDSTFQPLVAQFEGVLVVCTDTQFHAKTGDPSNVQGCPRGTWNGRMVVETVLSMLTTVCHFKKVGQRVWAYFQTRLAFTMALFNVLVQWHGLEPDEDGYIQLSIAEFSL